ncbi:glycosyltransferase family 4 protein [Clostridium chrysemydis]|uniref:glycosyltransferase family 4 protein n=1 Tax=Clostridium chrysemydis TaxID=2665504 RepID=UPI001883FA29|nr:glycosyltransferase family 4 protein [Clostridium chrysemydis]
MKKILYVTTISNTINAFLVPHIEHLIKLGYTVHIGCNILNEIDSRLIELGIKVHNIEFSRNPININNLRCIKKIRDIQEKEKYDVVHVHTPNASFLTRFALRKEKIKMIYTSHGFHFYKGAPIINWLLYYPLECIAGRWTDTLITINNEDFEVSKNLKLRAAGNRFLMNGVGIDEEKYESKSFDRDLFREKIGVKKNQFMILILAELNKNKNHKQIISTLKYMKNIENIKVICAGDGSLKEDLLKKIKILGLSENIKLIGFREDIKELLSAADCVALFSKREGLGKCLLEGIINNKILLATDTRGPRTLIKDGKNGVLVKVNDIKGTANAICKILEGFEIKSYDYSKYLLSNVLKDLEIYYKD